MNVLDKMELEKKIKNEMEAAGCYAVLLIIIGVPSLLTTIIFGSKVALVITLSVLIIFSILFVMTVSDIKSNKEKLQEMDSETVDN
ncbi:hypothetical protein NHG29_04130 [Aerococcaceae bacterium NML160702]|nr:hypothetical protein [Aerococcaceae bacterium NML160702]